MNLRKRKNEKKKLYILLLLLLTITIGIGYAILSEVLNVNSTIEYDTMTWDVGFEGATDGGGTVSSNPVISTDKKNITISCELGTSVSSETCIAKAKIKNGSTYNIKLDGNPEVTYNNTYVNSITVVWADNSKNVQADDAIGFGATRDIVITISTKELTNETLPESSLSIPITITMDWIEATDVEINYLPILTNEDFINGCYYNNGTLRTGNVFDKIKTIEGYITPQKIRVIIEDSTNNVSEQPYRVVYSAYDDSGKILNPNDTTNAMFSIGNGIIDLDLPTLYPTASQFKVDIFILSGSDFVEMPSTSTITVYSLDSQQETPLASKFANKKIDILGDSITAQAKYIPTLKTLTEASSIVNHGISGQKVTEFATRVTSLDSDADLIIVFGGTNDYWHHKTSIGTISDTTNETFYGALNVIYDSLTTNYPNAQYLFIFPPHQTYSGKDDTYDWGYGTLNDFRIAMQTVCSTNNIKFFDLGTVSEWDPATHTSDGVHPNADGGVLLADSIYEYLQKNF